MIIKGKILFEFRMVPADRISFASETLLKNDLSR